MKKIVALMIVCSLMAGCADAIPDPNSILGKEEITNEPDWKTINGQYTVVVSNNNSTVPIIEIGNNTTWLEISKVNYSAVHLSFTVVNNSVVFHNYSFEIRGMVIQDGVTWYEGYAPSLGKATMITPDFPYDITVNYTIDYREWKGNE